MNKEKVFAWIESLEDMADQSNRYFVERTELYKENQEKDKKIERLNNIINELEDYLLVQRTTDITGKIMVERVLNKLKELRNKNVK